MESRYLYEINDHQTGAIAIGKQPKAGVDRETRYCRWCLSVHPGRQAHLSKYFDQFEFLVSNQVWLKAARFLHCASSHLRFQQ